jgi:putative sterol carrier protein
MPAETVRAVFDRRKQNPFEPLLAGVKGTYRFDVKGAGSFLFSVDNGWISIAEGSRSADCVIVCDEDVFLRLADGSQNLLTAAMQGLVEIQGDLALAQKLHGILPPPGAAPEAGGPR